MPQHTARTQTSPHGGVGQLDAPTPAGTPLDTPFVQQAWLAPETLLPASSRSVTDSSANSLNAPAGPFQMRALMAPCLAAMVSTSALAPVGVEKSPVNASALMPWPASFPRHAGGGVWVLVVASGAQAVERNNRFCAPFIMSHSESHGAALS